MSAGVSTGLARPPNVVPSILSYSSSSSSTSTNHVPMNQSVSSSVSGSTKATIPLVNPATTHLSQSLATSNNLTTPLGTSSASGVLGSNMSLANAASILGSQPPLALGSISLLVQLYKQFQVQGNVQGMQKIKEQLAILQSQLVTKPKVLTGQTGLTGTINITPSSTSNVFQPVLVPAVNTLASSSSSSSQTAHMNGPSIVTNGIMRAHSDNNKISRGMPRSPSLSSSMNLVSNTSVSSLPADLSSSSQTPVQTTSMPTFPFGMNQVTGVSSSSLSSNSGLSAGLSLAQSTTVPLVAASSSTSSPSFVTHMTPSSTPTPFDVQVSSLVIAFLQVKRNLENCFVDLVLLERIQLCTCYISCYTSLILLTTS